MKIKVIGCSGAEFPGYNSPAFLLDNCILFDVGSLTNKLKAKEQQLIRTIFITHAHLDHIKSLPFLADNIIVYKKKIQINIYATYNVIKTIKKNLFNSAVWPDFTIIPDPTNAILNFNKINVGKPIEINSYRITAYNVNHTVPSVGYLVEDYKGKRFFYTGDTGPLTNTWKRLNTKKLNCLIIDVSFPNNMRKMALLTGHLTPELLKQEIKKIKNIPDRIYVTHPKPQYLKQITKQLKNLGIDNLKVLHDGDIINI
jgi:cAMP phosphodiesterase